MLLLRLGLVLLLPQLVPHLQKHIPTLPQPAMVLLLLRLVLLLPHRVTQWRLPILTLPPLVTALLCLLLLLLLLQLVAWLHALPIPTLPPAVTVRLVLNDEKPFQEAPLKRVTLRCVQSKMLNHVRLPHPVKKASLMLCSVLLTQRAVEKARKSPALHKITRPVAPVALLKPVDRGQEEHCTVCGRKSPRSMRVPSHPSLRPTPSRRISLRTTCWSTCRS